MQQWQLFTEKLLILRMIQKRRIMKNILINYVDNFNEKLRK